MPDRLSRLHVFNSFVSDTLVRDVVERVAETSSFMSHLCASNVTVAGEIVLQREGQHCAGIVVLSMLRAKDALTKSNPAQSQWKWRHYMKQVYNHQPFSQTSLRYFFHREVEQEGNRRTVAFARYNYPDVDPENGKWFTARAGAVLREVMELGGEGYISIDTVWSIH